MSFLQNLFGTIAGGSIPFASGMDFIPNGNSGETLDIKGNDALWMGLKNPLMQKGSYDFCFPVSCVLDRLAEMDTNGRFEILRSEGKGRNNFATNTWANNMNRLLDKPNDLQDGGIFRKEQLVYKRLFGYCPVLPLVPAGFTKDNAIAMINLPPWLFDVIPQEKQNIRSQRINERIKQYVVDWYGYREKFDPKEVMILPDSPMKDELKHYLLPQSKMVGLDMAVSNCCAAMEADNVLLRKKGPLGFISHDAAAVKDAIAGYLPMSVKQKNRLQNELTKYGLNLRQFQYVISRVAAKWNPMSFDVNQLGTKETVVASEKAICHRHSFPYVLYEMTDATYANGGVAAQGVYQDTIIPAANQDALAYGNFFEAGKNACKIVKNFDEVPVLQENRKLSAEADKAQNEALEMEYKNNLITLNQWRERRGYDTVDGDDYYLRDAPKEITEPIAA